ncbi:MAG: hypothetical protein WCX71_04530 [Candidatus Buchananbacteria bacterium]
MKNKVQNLVLAFALPILLALPVMVFAANQPGKIMSETRYQKISEVVQQLKEMANQDKGIGQEIRQIALEQENNQATTTALMQRIEARNRFKTFLLGNDYKNLGQLRKTIETTANQINRLENVLDKTQTEEIRTRLNDQITALKSTQSSTQEFIRTNEDKFSLFGWLGKFFNR